VKKPRQSKTEGNGGSEAKSAAASQREKVERLEAVGEEVVKRLDAAIAAIASILRGK
jgi:hypothetical protein